MPHVTFVLCSGFQLLAYVLAAETLRIANRAARDADPSEPAPFSWETRTLDGTAATASSGARIPPDAEGWRDARPADLVLLCAGYAAPETAPAGLRAFLARADRRSAVLGGVDTGAMLLAELGYLGGVSVVLHHEAEAPFRARWPEIRLVRQIYSLERRRLTVAGGTAMGDAMLAWIARAHSAALAAATSEAMAHGDIRSGAQPQQRPNHSDPLIAELERLASAADGGRLGVAALAARLGVSEKQLRRRCRLLLGRTPAALVLAIRLQRAAERLRGSAEPVQDIAAMLGFSSPAGFARAFRKRYGSSPRAWRQAALGQLTASGAKLPR